MGGIGMVRPIRRGSRCLVVRAEGDSSGGGGKKISQSQFTEKAWQVEIWERLMLHFLALSL
jgi:hypothetical protein